MRAALPIALLALLPYGACKKDKVEESKLRRSGDGPAVVVVGDTPLSTANLDKEVEPNEEVPQALVLGGGIVGTLDGSADIDRYIFEVEDAGMLFATVEGAGDADLKLDLRDSDDKKIASSDIGPALTVEGIAGAGLEPGTYQLVVTEFTKKKLRKTGGRQGLSQPYRLRAALQSAPEPGFELEDNATLEGASEIAQDEERFGYIGWKSDVDLWRLPIVGFGDVSADPEAVENQQALHILVGVVPGVDTSLSLQTLEGQTLLQRRARKGQAVSIRNFVPAVLSDAYLLRLEAKRSNPREAYSLRVESVTLAAGTEQEPNDDLESATPLGSDQQSLLLAQGSVALGDVDMFSISAAAENRVLEVQLQGPGDADLDLAVITASGALIAVSETVGAGGAEAIAEINVPPNSSPVIRVTPKKLVDPAEYKLSLTLVPGVAAAKPAPIFSDASVE